MNDKNISTTVGLRHGTGILPLRTTGVPPVVFARGGWIMAEMVLSITLLVMLLAGLLLTQEATRKSNAFQLTRQRCIVAAQAQIDSLSATGRPMAPADSARLWPGIHTALAWSDGQGQWQGLRRLTVQASGKVEGNVINVELSRYLEPSAGDRP